MTSVLGNWCNDSCYIGKGVSLGTNYDAALHIFNDILTPFIVAHGYEWFWDDDVVEKKFLKFMCAVDLAVKESYTATVQLPYPVHRNLPEDRDTFDFIIPCSDFAEFCSNHDEVHPIFESRLNHLIREFCYIYADVEGGKPGNFTQKQLDSYEIDTEEEDAGRGTSNANLPDAYSSRRKNDLY